MPFYGEMIMQKKTTKKVLHLAVAALTCAMSVSMFSGCESDRPEIEMQITFNNKTYTVDYVLYRKIAPSTTAHFLALAEQSYYDGMCIHSYESNRLYTGAYKLKDGELEYQKYYDIVKTYENFPTTVWNGKPEDGGKELYTLYGEFSDNYFSVNNGSLLSETFGSLTMYYTDKGNKANQPIDINPVNSNEWLRYSEYEFNSATSQFFISFKSTSATNSNYCTFATPTDEGKEALEDLQEAIDDYIEDTYGDETGDFTKDVVVDINTDDIFAASEEMTQVYSQPNAAIVIKSIKVTKY